MEGLLRVGDLGSIKEPAVVQQPNLPNILLAKRLLQLMAKPLRHSFIPSFPRSRNTVHLPIGYGGGAEAVQVLFGKNVPCGSPDLQFLNFVPINQDFRYRSHFGLDQSRLPLS